MKPRDYQRKAVNAVFSYLATYNQGNPLVVAPTGSGKTHLLAYFCQKIKQHYRDQKVLILTHTKEIIKQDTETLKKYLGPEAVAVYSAGLNQRNKARFTVAGIQSVYKLAGKFRDYSIIIVDEAHLIPPKGEGRYRTFFSGLACSRIIGLTATPYRLGHGYLTDSHLFDKIVYEISIPELIEAGYLCNITTKETNYKIDTTKLKIVAGDYSKKDMHNKLDNKNITEAIVEELQGFKNIRKSWLIFAVDIDHAEHIAETLNNSGIISAAVHSKLDVDRATILELFKAGHIQALVSVETLTTGFDAPNIDMIVLMRPTQSPVLHVQMVGRGMRISPNKKNCLVLDFAGNFQRLGPINDVYIHKHSKSTGKGNGEAKVKTCPRCLELLAPRIRRCTNCKYEFPIKLNDKPDINSNLITHRGFNELTKSYDVIRCSIVLHNAKNTGIEYLRVAYHCKGGDVFNEYISKSQLPNWWTKLGKNEAPFTIIGAVARRKDVKCPRQIKISFLQKYPRVISKIL